jgi:hypothetical protein
MKVTDTTYTPRLIIDKNGEKRMLKGKKLNNYGYTRET